MQGKNTLRIISLVPSLTELLVDLGLEDAIVGVTKFCEYPKHIRKEKTIVGGTKTIHLDKIIALQPTHILCNKEENTKEIVENCVKITATHVSDIYNIKDTLQLIKFYGTLFSREKEAYKLNTAIKKTQEDFRVFIEEKPILKVAYFIWKDPWMVAGNTTFINYLLAVNGFDNVYQNLSRYPEIELQSLKKVDLILLSSEPYPFKKKHIAEIKKHAVNTKIILVDGAYFSWYGSRLLKAFNYFKTLRNSL
ncbi:helical backbone metal receptor [uncultured Polaribacter sp.]|uniref:ABC transporter substrate-binding protein n=1 Tax=uncultured Polaribacter sp. TaxID=174711 RepID=UPI00260CA134|nr:helical backbone metal receptor [uncultured Polaribacter sp.]